MTWLVYSQIKLSISSLLICKKHVLWNLQIKNNLH